MHKRYSLKQVVAFVASLFSFGVAAAEYSVGQVWEYKSRKDEESSRVYIVHIDQHEKLGKIYHIYIEGINIKNPHIAGGIQVELPHAPVDEETLKLSLTKLVGKTDALPDISAGYGVWKEAFDSGEGGVFNIPISQIIQYIEDIVQKNA